MPEPILYENLAAEPSQGYVEVYIGVNGLPALADISYHHEERWLRLLFAEDLTTAQQTALDGIVAAATGQASTFRHQSGAEYEQMFAVSNGWTIHRRRVHFRRPSAQEPTVTLSNATFQNVSSIDVVAAEAGYFDYQVRAKGRNGASVQFDWEAYA